MGSDFNGYLLRFCLGLRLSGLGGSDFKLVNDEITLGGVNLLTVELSSSSVRCLVGQRGVVRSGLSFIIGIKWAGSLKNINYFFDKMAINY